MRKMEEKFFRNVQGQVKEELVNAPEITQRERATAFVVGRGSSP